jgi:uncharacterized membrane protein
VGPTFQNPLHTQLTDDRSPGSPAWRPIYAGGEHVRFAVAPADLGDAPAPWLSPRVVYLQNASDPITLWRPSLIRRAPDWLDEPRGPDISREMFWVPIITFWQTAADLAFSNDVPAGHGHVYGANPVDAWAAISPPEGWTADDTAALRAVISGKGEGG